MNEIDKCYHWLLMMTQAAGYPHGSSEQTDRDIAITRNRLFDLMLAADLRGELSDHYRELPHAIPVPRRPSEIYTALPSGGSDRQPDTAATYGDFPPRRARRRIWKKKEPDG